MYAVLCVCIYRYIYNGWHSPTTDSTDTIKIVSTWPLLTIRNINKIFTIEKTFSLLRTTATVGNLSMVELQSLFHLWLYPLKVTNYEVLCKRCLILIDISIINFWVWIWIGQFNYKNIHLVQYSWLENFTNFYCLHKQYSMYVFCIYHLLWMSTQSNIY